MQAVLFDMDGTIVKYKNGIETVFTKIFADVFKILELDMKNFDFFITYGRHNGIKGSLNELKIEKKPFMHEVEKKVSEVIPVEIEKQNIVLYDDVIEALDSLKDKYPLALVTNHVAKGVEIITDSLGIKPYFGSIVSCDSSDLREKPYPDMIFHAMKELKADSAVYVGDSKNDLESAVNAGLPFFLIEREKPKLSHHQKIKDLRELEKFI